MRSARLTKPNDDGVTLIELLVAMTLVTVLFTIVSVAFTSLYRTSTRTEVMSSATSQVGIAFGRLDGSIRYASSISEPGSSESGWFVEWGLTNTAVPQCFQLNLVGSTGILRLRSWSIGTDAQVVDLTGWQTLASDVAAPEGAPFVRKAEATAPHQQLAIQFSADASTYGSSDNAAFDTVFTALNSTTHPGVEDMCSGADRS